MNEKNVKLEEKNEKKDSVVPESTTNASVTTSAESTEKFCVLIVEPKSDLRTFFMSALTKTGNYNVKNAASAKEALDILEKEFNEIHLIAMDWGSGELNGAVLAQNVKTDSRFHGIDVLVCSSAITEEDAFLMTELDIFHVMPKVKNVGDYVSKIDEIRAQTRQTSDTIKKLKDLQHCLSEANLSSSENLFQDPIVLQEIEKNPRFMHLGGEFRILQRKYEEAVDFLKNNLMTNEHKGADNLKSLTTLGRALCLVNRFEEALVVFEKLESKSPKNLAHKVLIGDALLGMDNFPGAETKYKEVLNQDPNNKEALVGEAKVSAVQGDFEASMSFFEKVKGPFESRTLASFFNNRGVSLVRKGNINEAILFYENALQFLDKFKGHVYFNLGMAYYRIGNIASAVNCFQSALLSQDAVFLAEKKIIQELNEKGSERFIQEHTNAHAKV